MSSPPDHSHDESCPLLCDSDRNVEAQAPQLPTPTPLPKGQLAALCTVRIVEPIAFTQLFPYVNEFMSDLHLTDDPSRVGFYSGLVESVFALAQLSSIYHWARLSDVIGRRPIVLVGVLVTAITTMVFGLSKSLTTILIARCIGGLSSGNIAVIHSVFGEMTDSSNQATALPIFGLMYPLGAIIGPLIGGSFSHPADKYQIFDSEFWREYPYFLPCLIAAITAVIGVVLGYTFLEETLPSRRKQSGEKHPSVSDGVRDVTPSPPVPDKPMELRELLSLPIIWALAVSGFALSFLSTAFDVVFVLFCYSPIHSGGLAFSASQIGYSLATSGTILAAFQIFIMSYLLRTFDYAKMYNFCMGVWPFTYVALPILNAIARNGVDEATGQLDVYTTAVLWTGIAIVLAVSRVGLLAYSERANPGIFGPIKWYRSVHNVLGAVSRPILIPYLPYPSITTSSEAICGPIVMVSLACFSTTISRKITLHSKKTVA
ncbi:major facilitator superfamily domain-containing protein [Chiua virens]|nr:major facilitator superfamily domain-containing protein [Chiua virens]